MAVLRRVDFSEGKYQAAKELRENQKSVFVRRTGLCEWKITTANPILTILFKNILLTFEAEILKIFKNISLSQKLRRSYEKRM